MRRADRRRSSRRWSAQDLLAAARPEPIPNFENIDDAVHGPAVGPGQRVLGAARTGARPAGSTTTRCSPTTIATWHDFIDAAQGRGERQRRRVLDAPSDLRASTSGRTASTGTPRTRPTSTRARTSSSTSSRRTSRRSTRTRASTSPQGNYALSQAWNGDARQGLLVGRDDPDQYSGARAPRRPSSGWTTGASSTGAPNLDAAYAFINFILDPENSVTDLEFHGYNTGDRRASQALVPADLQFLDLVFFDAEQVATDGGRAPSTTRRTVRSRSTTRRRPRPGLSHDGRTHQRGRDRGRTARRRRRWVPRFALAMPSWVWYLGFFVVPVALHRRATASATSRGARGPAPIATDKLSLDQLRRGPRRHVLHDVPEARCGVVDHSAPLLCLLIGFPVRLLAGRQGAPEWRGPAAGAGDRPVLDELPDPHDRVADRARAGGLPLEPAARRRAP